MNIYEFFNSKDIAEHARKISIEELLRSHSIILMECYAKKMRKYFYHNKELLNDCGIEYKNIFDKKDE